MIKYTIYKIVLKSIVTNNYKIYITSFCSFIFKIFILLWSIVDLQYCISFKCTSKRFSCTYTYIYSFSDSFPV